MIDDFMDCAIKPSSMFRNERSKKFLKQLNIINCFKSNNKPKYVFHKYSKINSIKIFESRTKYLESVTSYIHTNAIRTITYNEIHQVTVPYYFIIRNGIQFMEYPKHKRSTKYTLKIYPNRNIIELCSIDTFYSNGDTINVPIEDKTYDIDRYMRGEMTYCNLNEFSHLYLGNVEQIQIDETNNRWRRVNKSL